MSEWKIKGMKRDGEGSRNRCECMNRWLNEVERCKVYGMEEGRKGRNGRKRDGKKEERKGDEGRIKGERQSEWKGKSR